jgi:ribonuclease J
MPVHGEHRHMHFHAELARATGIPDENVFLLENGDVLELGPSGAGIVGKVQAGMTLVDGFAMGDFRDLVLRDRQHLATDGLVIIVVPRSSQDGQIVGDLEVVFRGFAHAGDLDELTEKAKKRVLDALAGADMTQATDITIVKTKVHDVLQKFLHKEVGRRPMVLPVVVEL